MLGHHEHDVQRIIRSVLEQAATAGEHRVNRPSAPAPPPAALSALTRHPVRPRLPRGRSREGRSRERPSTGYDEPSAPAPWPERRSRASPRATCASASTRSCATSRSSGTSATCSRRSAPSCASTSSPPTTRSARSRATSAAGSTRPPSARSTRSASAPTTTSRQSTASSSSSTRRSPRRRRRRASRAHRPTIACPPGRCSAARTGAAHAFRPRSLVNISGMSYGSLSPVAVEALNRGAALAGCLQNTGEGGLAAAHQHGGELIFQIGTGYFGCRDEPGASRSSGCWSGSPRRPCARSRSSSPRAPSRASAGCCRRAKVTAEIARIRGVPAGRDCASPARHSAFSDVDGLIEFVERIADATGLPVGIKSAVGDLGFWDELASRMAATGGGPDFVTIDGGEGGTGRRAAGVQRPRRAAVQAGDLARLPAVRARRAWPRTSCSSAPAGSASRTRR